MTITTITCDWTAHGTMIKRLVCAMSRTHVARCVKWSRFGRGSMAKVGQDSGKEQKGRTRRGGRSDETRFAWDEGVSGRIQGRELREGITGGEEENVPVPEAQRRPFFTARTSVSGPRSPRNTNKNGELGVKTRAGTSRGSGRYGAKEENGKDGNQVPRDRGGPRGGKRTTGLTTRRWSLSSIWVSHFPPFFSSLLFSALPFSILASASVLHV